MNRGKATIAAAAVFAIGVAFAAQTTSERDADDPAVRPRTMWAPGTNGVQSAYEPSPELLPPAR